MVTNCLPLVILFLLVAEILCNNVTDKYNTMNSKEFQSRSHRFLTFDTMENGDISMELAFNVPFITIPVKKSVDMAKGAIANLNIGAVVLAGAIAFGFAVLIPGIVLLMSKKNFISSGYRSDDGDSMWQYLTLLDQALTENDIDSTSCLQRMICWTVKNSAESVNNGHSSSSDKIIDGLATSQWLQQAVEGTIVHSAVQAGLSKTNCSKEYSQCKISQLSFQALTKAFVGHINSRK